MFKSYLKSALRYLSKNLAFTFINVVGLAVGLVCSFLILLHISTELSYDKHFEDAENIYRIAVKSSMGDNQFEAAVTGGPLAITLEEELPEIVGHTRIREGRLTLIASDKHAFYEENILFADSNFFSLFNYQFKLGNPQSALEKPRSIVMTESHALKFFGDENPIGKVLKWNNNDNYTVTGIIYDPPNKSHLDFDLLVSFSTLYENQRFASLLQSYFAYTTLNYIQMTEGSDPAVIKGKIDGVVDKYMGDGLKEYEGKYDIFLQPIGSIYLHSDLLHEMKQSSDISQVYIFSGIAILILLIAGINFINLSTARSLNRSMEVGLRKVFGADRSMVFRQYMVESILTVFISALFALVLFDLFLPLFNRMTGNDFGFTLLFNWQYLIVLIPGIFLLSFLSGIYPALYLSGFKPITVMKKYISGGVGKSWFRNALVVVQFVISVFLLAGTFLINQQLNYMEEKDLGLDQGNIVVLSLRNRTMIDNYTALKAEMGNLPGVHDLTGSSAYLGQFEQRMGFYPEGKSLDDMVLTLNLQVDANYLDFFQTRMVAGRNFFENSKNDSNAIVINQAYMEQLGWDDPLGKIIYIPGQTEADRTRLKIVGVVQNFNFASLHQDVKPLIIMHSPERVRYISLKIKDENATETIGLISSKWEKLFPDYPFEFFMQQAVYEEMYTKEFNMSRLFKYFSVLALFIAVLGLLGLSSFTAEQRTKEIGIRKVLGSSVREILILITKDFTKWVILAIIVAIPITYLAMDKWLNHFAYHTNISWKIFLYSGLIAYAIAYVTITVYALKASRANPIESLQYE